MQPLFSYSYSLPYLAVFLILLFLAFNEIGKLHVISKKNSRIIAFCLMLFFIGLRGHLMTDFINYYPFFEHLPTITDLSISDLDKLKFEPGFIVYSSLVKTILPDYYAWVFVNTLLDLLVLYYVSRKFCLSTALLFMLLLVYWGLVIEINLYRNSKAIMLFLLSLPYLLKRSIVPYMALNLLGCSFHISSIVYLPMYFVLDREIPKAWVWGLFVFSNVVFFLGVSLSSQLQGLTTLVDGILGSDELSSKATRWQENKRYGESYGFSLGYLERLFFFVLFTLQYQKLILQRTTNRVFYNAFIIFYFLFHTLSPISAEIMRRMSILFGFSYWFLISNYLCQKRLKDLLFWAMILLCFMRIGVSTADLSMRYENILLGGSTDNYSERRLVAIRVFVESSAR